MDDVQQPPLIPTVRVDEVSSFLTVINVTAVGLAFQPKVEVLFTDGGEMKQYPFVFLVYRDGQVFSLAAHPPTNQGKAVIHAELSTIASKLVAKMAEASPIEEMQPIPMETAKAA